MKIVYASIGCSLGYLLVAATERGICAVSMGDSDPVLEAALAEEFQNVERVHDPAALSDWTGILQDYLIGRRPQIDFPLDLKGTSFQKIVWEALRTIPYGSTRSYGEIAIGLGLAPTSSRAVGQACATNPAALVVPCHRAVREDGGLGDYRWGVERKRALLEMESNQSQGAFDFP